MAVESSSSATRAGCWLPVITFFDVLIAIPLAFWLFDEIGFPWNVVVLSVMLLPLPFYFLDARRKRRLERKP